MCVEEQLQDRVQEETKERKNAVEEYTYSMRNKISDEYSACVLIFLSQFSLVGKVASCLLPLEGECATEL